MSTLKIKSMRGLAVLLAVALLLVSVFAAPVALAAKPTPTTAQPPAQGSFTDAFDSFDTARWAKADGWANGSPFWNGWLADHVTFANSVMNLTLDNVVSSGMPYTSGEYRTTGFYGYGCFEARFKPVAQPGVVTSLYTFAGPYDNGGNGKHNEIDVEFLGYDTTKFQANFWTNDDAYAQHHEYVVNLGFDASQSFHNYGFKWTSTGIQWYVDGALVYAVSDSASDPTPKTSDSLHKIMMNLWPVDSTASAWAGTFVYPGAPMSGQYDWMRYTQGESCTFGGPTPTPAPTSVPGNPTEMHVSNIVMSLVSRNTQATAKVTVVDGNGNPVASATVTGVWSGLVTSGDGSKVSGADGAALFYSGRSSNPGTFTFCVTGISKTGMTYNAGANAETCDSITK